VAASELLHLEALRRKELKNSSLFNYLPGGPFRASEAHRLPKSVAYVSAGLGQVKVKTAEKSLFCGASRRPARQG
jgi:hypothetical protein